jgi:hypothetical protein
MKSATRAKLLPGMVILVTTMASTACSSKNHEEACATSSSVIVSMHPGMKEVTSPIRIGGTVAIMRWSDSDTMVFLPQSGLSPFTQSSGGYLSFVAEKAGSFSAREVDVAGGTVAAVTLSVRPC